MANLASLLALLGQQGATSSPDVLNSVGTEDIVSTGRKTALPSYSAPNYSINEDSVVDTATINQAPPDMSMYPRTEASPQDIARIGAKTGLPEHKGLFGMKGTLRDVLGTIGDALLIAGNRNPIYAPQRQQEQLSDSLSGYGVDPQSSQDAIARAIAVDPEVGLKLAQQSQEDQLRREQYSAQAQTKISAQRIQKAKMVPNLLASARGNADAQKAIMAWYQDPESSIEDLDPETLANAAMSEYQKSQAALGDRRLDITERQGDTRNAIAKQNADANTKRANRPPAGRAPKSETADERYIRLNDKNPNSLTPGERAWLKNKTRKGGGVVESLKAAGGSKTAPLTKSFKPGQTVYKGGKAYKVNADGKTATPL